MALPTWAFGLAVIGLIVGMFGVLVPAVPGVAFMWIVILLYALGERFATVDPLSFAVLTLLALVGATSDLWMSQLGAKVGGACLASRIYGLIGGILGGLIGLFAGGIGAIPGMLVGSLVGVFWSEYRTRNDWKASLKATAGMLVGWTLSSGVQLVVGLVMLMLFVWQALRG
jgi:uncharacterized protein YqgC (DUF456 family)